MKRTYSVNSLGIITLTDVSKEGSFTTPVASLFKLEATMKTKQEIASSLNVSYKVARLHAIDEVKEVLDAKLTAYNLTP